ncbi:MAG: hypothetical protein KC619_16820 [Myxococcales bacterium]|nr:hypothetical protein [Myxococcales bacterium]
MAKREIVVTLDGEESSFKFAKVDREKLYGKKERVILDENGNRCVAAFLTADGAALVPPGGTAHVYVDETFDTIERKDLRAVDDEGEALEPSPSTLGVAQALAPATAERLLDHVIASVYALSAESLGDGLAKALAGGAIFECAYQYREGYDTDALFLLQNDEGVFGLVGRPSGFEYLEREASVAEALGVEDEEDDLGDDFDFSMM